MTFRAIVAGSAALIAITGVAEAKILRLTCTDAATKAKYDVAYDDGRNTLTTTHKDFTSPLEVEKTQTNENGILVWGVMRLRPAAKSILLHFGKEKWAVHFSGYNDQRKDSCV